ncbi:HNH endonuclease family protein [Acrocarpospora catenulata]|uniref:HNH endonuclease family protein n=1 Tax=Acrocarpospora catenulata TaxID=2836182 RepID=UPI001BDAE1CA|nr:HNH endonuclease family protein [Acrocarpospora catenulata]
MQRVIAPLVALCATLALSTALSSPASATPPGIPSAATATSQLAALTVANESNSGTYNRALFPHWITISGTCDTRETVLKRDGSNVVTNSSCSATSGSWYSPYDGATWTLASDVDIDHMVPLSEAWKSGAWAWTTSRRQEFANDLSSPQLWAVTDNVNQSKGDKDPAAWKPSRTAFWCTYAKSWIAVKYKYGLSLQSTEKSALTTMLGYC